MSVPQLGRFPIVIGADRAAPEVRTQYRYCVMRRIVRMIPAIDRM